MGEQRVTSYTITVGSTHIEGATTIASETNSDDPVVIGFPAAQESSVNAEIENTDETANIVSERTNNQ